MYIQKRLNIFVCIPSGAGAEGMGGATGGCGGTMSPHFWDQRGTGGTGGGPMKMIFASTTDSLYYK